MCTAVYIDGTPYESRDALEAAIGERLRESDEQDRIEQNHCLCPYDVVRTLVALGYTVRGYREGDIGMSGDIYAWRER